MKRHYIALGLIAVGIGAGVMTGCKRGGSEAPAASATPAAQTEGTLVSLTPARIGSIERVIEATGALNALQDVTVGVKANGKVMAVYLREGDYVKAGQIVAQQDTSDLQNQLEQQRANLLSAQSKLSQSRVALQNAQTTLKWTDEQTRSAVRLAQAGLEVARQQAAVVKEGARPQERQQSQENLAAAKADRDKARADLKRYQELYRQQAVAAQQLDQAQSIADSADARYNAAAQALSLVQEGSRVEDIRRAQAAVEQANQQVATAQSNRDQVNLRRADVENARVGILAAQAGVRQAQAGVRLAEQAISDASVRSPLSGVVAERKVEPGMLLTTVKPEVVRIVSLDSIYFDAQISETQYSDVRAGQAVTITVDALPGRAFKGTVNKIFPVASASARSFTARIHILNEGNVLRPQMFARGRIVMANHPRAILVPREAILDLNENKGRVFVAKNKTAKERPVTIGFVNLRDAEILSGLEAGEKVVTVGQAQLKDGDTIQLPSDTEAAVTRQARNVVP